jgi:hypothetical protein
MLVTVSSEASRHYSLCERGPKLVLQLSFKKRARTMVAGLLIAQLDRAYAFEVLPHEESTT